MGNSISNQLHSAFLRLMSDYASIYDVVYANKDWKNSFRDLISKELPTLLCDCVDIRMPYSVVGSYGKGLWTAVPWIAVFDTRITSSAQKGVYIVYLLNKDTKELFLTFEIAATEAMGTKTNADGNVVFFGVVGNNNPELKEKLQERAEQIREVIQDTYFNKDSEINSGASGYDSGAVYYKRYHMDSLPSGDVLSEDLCRMMNIYRQYYEWINTVEVSVPETETQKEEGEEEMQVSAKDAIIQIKNYIESRGYSYKNDLIENFYLSLKSKPFVILAGTSGTGKTRLVKLFAEAIGAEYKLVPVRPDWSDGSDLFGHYDLNGKFIDGPVCECFKYAEANPNKPVLLCLDEMNLARVEYYFSGFLSVIETREKDENGKIVTKKIEQYKDGIPENLYIIGTVNMDETTFPFSKKVLDRANTIEFSYVDLMPQPVPEGIVEPQKLPNSFLRSDYLVLAKDCDCEDELVVKVCGELQYMNTKLAKANAHVGYRVRDEIVFYMLNNRNAGDLLTYEQAMDNEIMQKILPRIQGSSAAIKTLLIDLFKFCMGNESGIDADTGIIGEQMKNAAASAKYPESAKKIGFMMTRFEDDGFTSYWL